MTFGAVGDIIYIVRRESDAVEDWVPSRGVRIPWKTFQKNSNFLLTPLKNYAIINTSKEKERNKMKIFVTKKYPTIRFYYKVLEFLLDHGCRSEIDHYLDMIEESRKNS